MEPRAFRAPERGLEPGVEILPGVRLPIPRQGAPRSAPDAPDRGPARLRDPDAGRPVTRDNDAPLPAGHPISWGAITAGTILEGSPFTRLPRLFQPHGRPRKAEA